MTTVAIVPYRSRPESKSRLSERVDRDERERLSLALLVRVVTVLKGVPSIDQTRVVSPHPIGGMEVLSDTGAGLNPAVQVGATWASDLGADILLVVSADLPFLSRLDVQEMLVTVPPRGGVIAPSKDGGTNALALRPPEVIGPCFGANSARQHQAQLESVMAEVRAVHSRGLAADVDVPADLDELSGGLLEVVGC